MPLISIVKPITAPKATASIGDRVWYDTNANGIQDAGEAGAAGITVTLVPTVPGQYSQWYAQTTTDAQGNYHFNNLSAGSYHVDIATPNGYVATKANATSDDRDSDFVQVVPPAGATWASASSSQVTLADGQSLQTLDAGLVSKAALATGSIGDRVWYDTNANGIQDAGEAGAAGIKVTLVPSIATGPLWYAETTTDALGNYRFSNLSAGSYTVSVATPNGYVATKANATSDDRDSDFVQVVAPVGATWASASSSLVTLAAGQSNLTLDAGLVAKAAPATASIGDFVWSDNNANGIQDAGEGGMAGIKMTLVTPGGVNGPNVVATTMTDSTGHYHFNNLAAGTYAVGMYELPGVPTSRANATSDDRDSDFVGGMTAPGNPSVSINPWVQSPWTALAAGQSNQTLDVGVAVPPWMQVTNPLMKTVSVEVTSTATVNEPLLLKTSSISAKLASLLQPADDLLHQAFGHYAADATAAHAVTTDGGDALRQMLAQWSLHHAA